MYINGRVLVGLVSSRCTLMKGFKKRICDTTKSSSLKHSGYEYKAQFCPCMKKRILQRDEEAKTLKFNMQWLDLYKKNFEKVQTAINSLFMDNLQELLFNYDDESYLRVKNAWVTKCSCGNKNILFAKPRTNHWCTCGKMLQKEAFCCQCEE